MYQLSDLLHLMARLRDSELGCPWDLQQSYATIVPYTLEEAYEVADAIGQGGFSQLREKLSSPLLQVIYYSQLARGGDRSAFDEVMGGTTRKLIRRYPHVFLNGDLCGKPDAAKLAEATVKWRREELKIEERTAKAKEPRQLSLLDDVLAALPALSRAAELQERAAQAGFDWPEALPVVDKVHEELDEVLEVMAEGDKGAASKEVGDLLFVVVSLARHLEVDLETALHQANGKLERRFRFIGWSLCETGRKTEEYSLEELNSLWGEAKKVKRNASGYQ